MIGWLRPVILLPVTAVTGLSEQQLDAIIAHELAHIRRLDSFVNLFQVVVETLLFYHPAVWWVNRRIRAEREDCCEYEASRARGDAMEYARALTLMEEWRSAPVLVMAASRSALATRVLRLLGMGRSTGGIRSAGFAAGSLCLAGALVAGNALLCIGRTSSSVPLTQSSPDTDRAADLAARPVLRGKQAVLVAQAAPSKQAKGHQKPGDAPEESADASKRSKEGFIEQMSAAGLKDLTVDQLVAMKTQGVTAEYVEQMRALGLNPNPDELIGMRVQGVTPEYVGDMRGAAVSASAEQLVAMKVQGVSPEYVKAMHDLSLQPDADTLVGMRVQGVTPDYIREMRASGW